MACFDRLIDTGSAGCTSPIFWVIRHPVDRREAWRVRSRGPCSASRGHGASQLQTAGPRDRDDEMASLSMRWGHSGQRVLARRLGNITRARTCLCTFTVNGALDASPADSSEQQAGPAIPLSPNPIAARLQSSRRKRSSADKRHPFISRRIRPKPRPFSRCGSAIRTVAFVRRTCTSARSSPRLGLAEQRLLIRLLRRQHFRITG